LCHFDGIETETGIDNMVKSLKKLRTTDHHTTPIELSIYIVGGFIDHKQSSLEITHQLIG
jgi:hypothetical protein